jgi:transposase
MIHKVKAMYDEGRGSSQREIAARLKISRNTVRKYIEMSAEEIAAYREGQRRRRRLDLHRGSIIHLLETYPRLSAVKVLRKLREAHGEVAVSARSMRRYIEQLRGEVVLAQPRYYEPVLAMVPGEQCQVDGGELRGVRIGGVETTVYLMVFVLSYSRLMYVAASTRPIDTAELIRMHDAAFRYFGGCPRECVYDQTKLVVIEEQFRELILNARFARYAATVGFRIHACEGYDPESKGKVEAGVKYVKRDGLYGETFADVAELHAHLRRWLDEVANVRVHGVTGELPRERYARAEQAAMRAYLIPTGLEELSGEAGLTRLADKTGLIAYKANKYSVPLAYQRARVGVCEADGELLVTGPVQRRDHRASCPLKRQGRGDQEHQPLPRSRAPDRRPGGRACRGTRQRPRSAPVRPAARRSTAPLQGPAARRAAPARRPWRHRRRRGRASGRKAAPERHAVARPS